MMLETEMWERSMSKGGCLSLLYQLLSQVLKVLQFFTGIQTLTILL